MYLQEDQYKSSTTETHSFVSAIYTQEWFKDPDFYLKQGQHLYWPTLLTPNRTGHFIHCFVHCNIILLKDKSLISEYETSIFSSELFILS